VRIGYEFSEFNSRKIYHHSSASLAISI